MNKITQQILLFFVCVGILILFFASSHLSELNQDEGWYLYASRLVSHGEKPYVDFSYTQGPIMCYVYSIFTPIINNTGILGGRLITAIFGIIATVLCSVFAARCVRKVYRFYAFITTLALCGFNIFYISFTTIVKTYALCACFIMAGFLLLSFIKDNSKKNILYLITSGICFGLATSVRVSAGIALPIIFCGLLFMEFKKENSIFAKIKPALLFTLGALLTGAIVYIPLYIKSPEACKFFVFEYHALRSTPTLFTTLAYKIGFLSRFLSGTLIVSAIIVVAIVIKTFKLTENSQEKCFPFIMACLTFVGISLLHLSASFPYDDYQIIIYPLMVAIATIAVIKLLSSNKQVIAFTYMALILSAIFTLSSPKIQEWFVTRDRIWWPIKEEYPLQTLQKAADKINELKTNNLLLTQDAYLAIETGMDLPENMELGPFSYFPEMPAEKAKKLHVLNKEMLIETLQQTDASVVAVSGYGFSIECPNISPIADDERQELIDIINNRYKLIDSIPNFGQAYTELDIYTK